MLHPMGISAPQAKQGKQHMYFLAPRALKGPNKAFESLLGPFGLWAQSALLGPFRKVKLKMYVQAFFCFIQSFRKAMFLHTTMSCNGSSHPLLHQRHQPSAQIKARAKGYHELRGFSHPPLYQWHQPSTQIKAKAKGYHELRGSSHPLLYQWHQLSTAHPCNC
jgi:hypothetical protein